MVFREVILILVDIILAAVALLTAAVGRFGVTEFSDSVDGLTTAVSLSLFIAIILFSSHLMEVYAFEKNTRRREILINILFAAATSFSLLSVVYYLYPDVMMGRGVLLLSLALFIILQFVWHTLFWIENRRPRFSRRVLILGTGTLAAQLGEMVASSAGYFSLVGYASCSSSPVNGNSRSTDREVDQLSVPPGEIIGDADGLLDTATRVKTDLIVAALAERRGVFPLRDVLKCKLNGIQVMDAPAFYELVQGKLMLESITPGWFIFSSGFRRTSIFSFCKRSVDVVLSLVGLLMTLPVFPLIACAIKLDSPGPIFFRQQRVGMKEKPFMLFKFRSMRQDAEQGTGAVWAGKNDPRVTTLGKFLRNTRIDEIPQLINVLKGEMSFVGPRPERPEFVEKLQQLIPFYSKRHFIKPGLTGWAQVRYPYGASVEDAIEKLRYDLYYLKNIGPFLDTLIFFDTIKVVLFGKGVR
ncbi:MAG TPA: TIGR03013 family PEP-CTERM/XrtA system glycosyltransferase [Desulfuromonadales bacterium]|nr:TIGR03013 family PEP-CTERM/XrtA system glycosyltransferase [Desulfuromonadales bacterium]